jgi:hypothetical protein
MQKRAHAKHKKKQDHHVFIILAHGSMQSNMIKIDTSKTHYYDLGKEMHILASNVDFSDFAKNTPSNAVRLLKQNRGILNDFRNIQFETIIDDTVPEAYIFDRHLQMFPFETGQESISKGKLIDPNLLIFSVGVYEVNPLLDQTIAFTDISSYKHLSDETKDGLRKIAKELHTFYEFTLNRKKQLAMVLGLITFAVLKLPSKLLNVTFAAFLFKFFLSQDYAHTKAYKDLTKNSVIPITKTEYTLSEIISELRKIPKYKHGVHHIVILSCYGGLHNKEHVEQIIKIQHNEEKMNVNVHKSFYIDAKRIYDISSDNSHLSSDNDIYNLLEMIKIEKSNIETETPIPTEKPFFSNILCFFKKKEEKCMLYQNNVTVDAIIAICNITKLWLEILQKKPDYLDDKHRRYVEKYNAKYMCSESIEKEQIDKILDKPISKPVELVKDYFTYFFDRYEIEQPEIIRRMIDYNIKLFIYLNTDIDLIPILNPVLLKYELKIVIPDFEKWRYYLFHFMFKRFAIESEIETSLFIDIVEKFGNEENKESLRAMLSSDYIDIVAKTRVETLIMNGTIPESEFELEYDFQKSKNFTDYKISNFKLYKYKFETTPVIFHGENLDQLYWKSLLTAPLLDILHDIIDKLKSLSKDYEITYQPIDPPESYQSLSL